MNNDHDPEESRRRAVAEKIIEMLAGERFTAITDIICRVNNMVYDEMTFRPTER